MRVLLLPLGSGGDVYPFVGLGARLARRGHEVTVGANAVFRQRIESVGLEFVELGNREEYESVFRDARIWHPYAGYLSLVIIDPRAETGG